MFEGKYQQAHVVSVMCGRQRTNELSWNGQSVTRANKDSDHSRPVSGTTAYVNIGCYSWPLQRGRNFMSIFLFYVNETWVTFLFVLDFDSSSCNESECPMVLCIILRVKVRPSQRRLTGLQFKLHLRTKFCLV